jgi:sugar lactone lactonase YvrE
VAVDGLGNLFTTDTFQRVLYKLDLSNSNMSVLAGGTIGSADGTGSAAQFGDPTALAADTSGNVYVADSANHTIRKVVLQSALVTTVAGAPPAAGYVDGPADAARFNTPQGIAADGAGNLYVADRNHVLRRIDAETAMVTTLAGDASHPGSLNGRGSLARFSFSSAHYSPAVTSDCSGHLFIVDQFTRAIRRATTDTGYVVTLPMLGAAGATSAASDCAGRLYFTTSSRIVGLELASGVLTRLAGAADDSTGSSDGVGDSARFYLPRGVAHDRAGNVYVADTENATIRKIAVATGAGTTFAGVAGEKDSVDGIAAAARFRAPAQLALDVQTQSLYVLDARTVRKVSLADGQVTTIVGTGGPEVGVRLGGLPADLSEPAGLALLPTGGLAITDAAEHSVLIAHF